jgi:hypothetical protein
MRESDMDDSNKAFRIIVGIITPILLFIVAFVLAEGNGPWNKEDNLIFIWIPYLLVVFVVETYLFSRTHFEKIKKSFFKLLKFTSLVILPIIVLLVIVLYFYNNQPIPPSNFEVLNVEGRNFFTKDKFLGNFLIKIKNNSAWDSKDIQIRISVFYKKDSMLVVQKVKKLGYYYEHTPAFSEREVEFNMTLWEEYLNHPKEKRFGYEIGNSIKENLKKEKKINDTQLALLSEENYLKLWYSQYLSASTFNSLTNNQRMYMEPNDWLQLVYKKNRKGYREIEKIMFLDKDFIVKAEIVSALKVTFLD